MNARLDHDTSSLTGRTSPGTRVLGKGGGALDTWMLAEGGPGEARHCLGQGTAGGGAAAPNDSPRWFPAPVQDGRGWRRGEGRRQRWEVRRPVAPAWRCPDAPNRCTVQVATEGVHRETEGGGALEIGI